MTVALGRWRTTVLSNLGILSSGAGSEHSLFDSQMPMMAKIPTDRMLPLENHGETLQ